MVYTNNPCPRAESTQNNERERKIYRVTIYGAIANIILCLFKLAAGIVGRSSAMIADGIHSLSDLITDFIVIAFVRISSKPQDRGHEYGHGKYETLATTIIGLMLLFVGLGIMWNSITQIWSCLNGGTLQSPGWIAFVAAILSIVVKEALFQYTRNQGRQLQSQAVIANAWHHRSDALSSIGTLTRQRNDEGATSLSDVVQTDARIEGARSQLMQYQASLDSSRATLMSLLGWDSLNAVSNDFPQSLARSCDIAEPDDRLVPSVLAAWAQANVAQANLDYANAQMTPTVSLEPEVRHYLNDRYAGNETRDRTQYSAWVKVQMPLYQGGGLTARRNAAGHAVESAQSTIQRTRLEVRQKLLEARSQVMSLMSTLQIQGRQEALSARTRELYQQQYLDLGSRPLLDVLNAEQEVYQARFTQQQTAGQLHQLQLNCLYNTGRLRHAFDLENRTIQTVEIQP